MGIYNDIFKGYYIYGNAPFHAQIIWLIMIYAWAYFSGNIEDFMIALTRDKNQVVHISRDPVLQMLQAFLINVGIIFDKSYTYPNTPTLLNVLKTWFNNVKKDSMGSTLQYML